MNEIESDGVIKKMMDLWPNWNPSDTETRAFKYKLAKYDLTAAIKAINDAAFESDYRTPPRKTVFQLMNRHQPKTEIKMFGKLPDPTTFLMYYGGGTNALNKGFFMPIYCHDGPVMKAAQKELERNQKMFGGEWRVYEKTTFQDMINLRSELRHVIINKTLASIFKDLCSMPENRPVNYDNLPF